MPEATQISPQAQGYQDTPGIYTPEQIAGWRVVTDAVHAKGGRIFLQIWHGGPGQPCRPSAGRSGPGGSFGHPAATKTFVNNMFVETSTPRALELDEIPTIVADFRRAAANAITAGFRRGRDPRRERYLLDQFAKDGANHRTDAMAARSKTAPG